MFILVLSIMIENYLKMIKNLNIPKFSLIGFSLKSNNGWRKWRDDNDMNSVRKYDYFCFRINNNNLALENIDDIKKLPHYTNKGRYSIDYEALLKMDYPIYALHMKSKVAKYLLGIEYDCALVLSDVCLIENYSDNVKIKFTKMDRLIFTNLDRII